MMAPHTVETEIQPEGLIQVRIPDARSGQRVRVTVEEIGPAPSEVREGVSNDPLAAQRTEVEALQKAYSEGRITQSEYSQSLVRVLERYETDVYGADSPRRVLGQLKGKIRILPGFDDPIEGLEWAYE
jgi:hypothetical protein